MATGKFTLGNRRNHIYRGGVGVGTVQAPPFTLSGLTPGEIVELSVAAVNATGEGPMSGTASGTAGQVGEFPGERR